ncbi:MAG: hypothetical protein Kow0069_22990 [Promethearchaeota archaeon]
MAKKAKKIPAGGSSATKQTPRKKTAKKSTKSAAKKRAKKATNGPAGAATGACFVIDANFFICLKQGGKFAYHVKKFGEFARANGFRLAISRQVFEELRWVQGSLADEFQDHVAVHEVAPAEVEEVKGALVSMGYRVPAQDPDLSLVVLAKKAAAAGQVAYLVSDDFKLSQNVTSLKLDIKFLSLGAFVLKFHNAATLKADKRYFKVVRNKIMEFTISYALSRHKEYDVTKKVAWMIERAVSVAEEGLRFGEEGGPRPACGGLEDEEVAEQLRACQRYLKAEKPKGSVVADVEAFLPFLNEVSQARRDAAAIQRLLLEDEVDEAIKTLHVATRRLSDTFQLASATLKGSRAKTFRVLVCAELANLEFLAAFLYLNHSPEGSVNQYRAVAEAYHRLDRAAFFANISANTRAVLTLNYTKAILLVFSGNYEEAFHQYDFTTQLAMAYGERSLELKCKIGKSIAMMLSGEEEGAAALMELVSYMTRGEENVAYLKDAQVALNEIADYFYALGRPEIALALYDESLECAVDAGLDHKVETLVEKIKRATLAAAFRGFSGEVKVDSIIDRAYEVRDVEKYNAAIARVSEIHALFYSEFPYYSKKKSWERLYDLPEEVASLGREMELVEVKRLAQGTLLVAYSESLGLVGVILPEKDVAKGIPENYSMKLKMDARVRIQRLSEEMKAKYLIRAVVRVESADQLELTRHVPKFFVQVKA